VHFDRWLDRVAFDATPLAVCELRAGTRLGLPAAHELQLHCVVAGRGALGGGAGPEVALRERALVLVPAGLACTLAPEGATGRALSFEPARSSDHVPKLVAGTGGPGLVVISARVHALGGTLPAWLATLREPTVLEAEGTALGSVLRQLHEELEARRPGSRRMAELLLSQALTLALRARDAERAAG